jgi:membrane protease YdiL (CAAX protease family)
MKGLLKHKSAFAQLMLAVFLALFSFIILGGVIAPFILSAITGINVLEIAKPDSWDFSKPEYVTLLRGLQFVQFVTLFLIPVFIAARLYSTDERKYLGLQRPWSLLYFLAAGGALLLALPLVEWLGQINQQVQFPQSWMKWMKESEDSAGKLIKGLLTRHTIKDLLLNVFFIAGLAAVGEELLFRGLLQRLFIKLFKNHWIGIITAAILFSAIHMQFFGFLPRFALGIVLGVVYWYSGSLWVAMAAHFVYDATLIVVAYYTPSNLDVEQGGSISNIALLAAGSFLIVAAFVTWMIRNSRTTYSEVYSEDSIPIKR